MYINFYLHVPLGHYVLFLCFRSEQNPKSNDEVRKGHLGKKTMNLFLEKL